MGLIINVADRIEAIGRALVYGSKTVDLAKLGISSVVLGNVGVGRLSENQDPEEQVKHFKHWIYAAVDARATAVAQAKLRVYMQLPDGERREVQASDPGIGELVRLLEKPNPFQTGWQFRYKNQVYIDLTGDMYFLKDRLGLGRIEWLWTLMPQGMSVSPKAKEEPGFTYRPDASGKEVAYEGKDIVHGLYPDPQSEWYGVSPLQAATEAVNVHRAIHESQDKTFQHAAEPSLIITAPGSVKPEDLERIRHMLAAKHQGSGNAGKSLVLEGGLTASPWMISPKEMNYLESSGMNRDELLGIYKVPAAILGLSKDVNRSSADAMEYIYAKWTITPLLDQWQTLLTEKVCKEFDKRAFCEFDSVIPEDEEGEHKRLTSDVKEGVISRNEMREVRGFEPAEDGNADALLVNINLVPIGKAGEAVEEPVEAGPEEEAADGVVRTKQDGDPLVEPPFAFDPEEFVGTAISWDDEAEEMTVTSRGPLEAAVKNGWDNEVALVPGAEVAVDFDATLAQIMGEKDFAYFDFLLEETRDDLRKALTKGLEEGEGFKQIADRVMDVYTTQGFRAERIARTEVGSVQGAASQQARNILEVPFKEWVAVFVNTRPTHADANGQVVRNDQYFSVGAASLMYPRDLSGPPAETVNCQCSAAGSFSEKGLNGSVARAYAWTEKSVRTRQETRLTTALEEFFKREGDAVLAALTRLREER